MFLVQPGELIKQLTPAHVQKVQGEERELTFMISITAVVDNLIAMHLNK